MRFVFLAGGLAGFLAAGVTGWASDHAADRMLFDAAVGALAGGLLLRWFWTVVLAGIRDAFLSRRRAALAAAPASATPKTPHR
ncbi:MAG TPA: hypothetical protein VEB66_15775 [Opitutaceae bacterium]|nr:hypothetical protein [Opitutaceae bacterium]